MTDSTPPLQIPTIRGFLSIAGQQFVGIALGIGVWIMLARILPISEFGEFTAAFGLAMLGGAFANLGLPQYVMMPFRSAISTGDFDIARGLRRVMPWLLVGSGFIAYGVIIGAKEVFGSDCTPRQESVTTVLALLPLTVLMRYLATTAKAHGAAGRAMFLTGPGLYLLIALGLWRAWSRKAGEVCILDVSTGWVAASLIICIALWYLNLSVEHDEFKRGKGTVPWRKMFRGSFPFFLSGLGGMLLVQAPFPILGWICDEGRQAAIFAAADRLAKMLLVAYSAGTALFLPLLADAIQSGNQEYYRRLIRRWFSFVGGSSLLVFGLLALFGHSLLGLYGDAYQASYPILLVAGTWLLFTVATGIFLRVLQYGGAGMASTLICVSASVVGVAGMIGLGWIWGAMGVAIAQAVAFIGMYVMLTVKARTLVQPPKPA
ncbi:MAG: hypothetical protein P8I44_04460 [Phycisphaerales bacterium]|nr:hypothetical protein [Phycisphaerales bacterium]MDG1977797.1 hypothetical protein [Phycisphaerales bacterium]